MSARALRVVMVTPSAIGGHARYTWELMNALREAVPPSELQLALLTSTDLGPEFRSARYEIAAVLPPLRRRDSFSSHLEWAASRVSHYACREEAVLRWVRGRGGVDVVHYQEPPFAGPLHFARVHAIGACPVATVHNLRPHHYWIAGARWVTDLVWRVGWRQCSTLFVHSSGLAERLGRECGRRAPPIVSIPHGVWTGHGTSAPEARRDGYLLMFGVMRRNKGPHLMLDTLRLLPQRRLLLAGAFEDAVLAREVRDRIAAARLDVIVVDHFIPESEVQGLFAGASLAMLPYTDFHGQSGALHMAIAYGVPSVVTDVGALGEQVRREGIGAVAPSATAAELARAVLRALEPEAHDAARRRCIELARSLSWSTAAARTLEAYRRLRCGREL
jgi:glycosyltransferase involved in cell wall biosynthesis